MKKNKYVSPACKEYAVRMTEIIALSFGNGEADGDALVKEQKEEQSSGSGIWDLYN